MQTALLCIFLLSVRVEAKQVSLELGIIYPKAASANAVAQLALDRLYDEGTLNNDTVTINVRVHETSTRAKDAEHESQECQTAVIGVASLVLEHACSAIIGPHCNQEMEVVATMAADWNLLVIGYESPHSDFFDKQRFPTLGRTSTTNAQLLAEATVEFLRYMNWNRVALIVSSDISWHQRSDALEAAADITIAIRIEVPHGTSASYLVKHDLLEPIKKLARVVLVEIGASAADNQAVMEALHAVGIGPPDYVVISVRAHSDDVIAPWYRTNDNKRPDPQLKIAFTNTFMIDIHNYGKSSLKSSYLDLISTMSGHLTTDMSLVPLFDAVYLYGLAVARTINDTQPELLATQLRNGTHIWANTHGVDFAGPVGKTIIDHLGERVLSFEAYFINKSTVEIPHEIIELNNVHIDGCDDTHSGDYHCYHIVAKTLYAPEQYWPFNDGKLPLDTPECGFENNQCWTTMETAAIVIAVGVVLTIVIGSVVAYRWRMNTQLERTVWRIQREDVRIPEPHSRTSSQVQSVKTLDTVDSRSSVFAGAGVEVAIVSNTIVAQLTRYAQHQHIVFRRGQLAQLNEIKRINHENLCYFVGMCLNQGNELFLMWSLEKRGPLQDLLFDTNFELDINFKTSFIKDVVKGVEYLHSSPIGYHGRLSTVSCKVAAHWGVKLYDFGLRNIFADLVTQRSISYEPPKDQPASEDTNKITALTGFTAGELVQFAPELLRSLVNVSDERGEIPAVRGTVKGDIYSLGMVIYQILYRKEPYEDYSAPAALEKLLKGSERVGRPRIPESAEVNSKILALFEMCWSDEPEERPAVKRIRNIIDGNMKTRGSVVDHMMKMMEQYANNLQGLVKERTAMLEEAQQRADHLLSQMLPRSVIDELKAGRQVAPTMYDGATVLFTDLVGFTNLCSDSTPLQIVTLLNELYSDFDGLIALRDCYKVETIGDSYMVVSGIPTPNGNKHVHEAAELALAMVEAMRVFRVPHSPSRRMEVRIGFHTGSVAAGVVGLATPRYCLFGDTVNMASRMESNGEPMKIQISENAKQLLVTSYPQFLTAERGVIPIKGKGECRTYWLMSKMSSKSK